MAKVGQEKEKDFDAIDPRVNFSDMPEERREAAIQICREAYSRDHQLLTEELDGQTVLEMQHDGELKYFKDLAAHVKQEMEKKFGGSWHIIVGKVLPEVPLVNLLEGTHFGSFVSYEHTSMILFWLEHIGFLLFKHS